MHIPNTEKFWSRKKIENDSEKKNGNIVLRHIYIYITRDINADAFHMKNSHIY